jgi:hypothetical protein
MKNEDGSSFLQMVVTGDESWIYEYDPETKRQSEEWKHTVSPRSKKEQESLKNDHTHCFILIFEEWSMTYLFHRVRQLMPPFMWKF